MTKYYIHEKSPTEELRAIFANGSYGPFRPPQTIRGFGLGRNDEERFGIVAEQIVHTNGMTTPWVGLLEPKWIDPKTPDAPAEDVTTTIREIPKNEAAMYLFDMPGWYKDNRWMREFIAHVGHTEDPR